MSLLAQAKITEDNYIIIRIKACAAKNGVRDPHEWTMRNIWALAASGQWAEKYARVLGGEDTTDPAAWAGTAGADPNVITDTMIGDSVLEILADEAALAAAEAQAAADAAVGAAAVGAAAQAE